MARSVSRGPRALGDTSIFVALEQGRQMATNTPGELAISFVTVAELTVGVLLASTTVDRARRLETLIKARSLYPMSIDESVAAAWAELRVALRESKRKLPINDSWIAATAIAHRLPLVTRDGDYAGVPGLHVIQV
jgi:predicted nucleic acid-binding protein